MKTVKFFVAAVAAMGMVAGFSSCEKEGSDGNNGEAVVLEGGEISGRYSNDLTLKKGEYTLTGSLQMEAPATLTIEPGTTIYMQGHDQDGGDYISSTIVIPDENEDANTLAINAQWNYNLMDATLPEASQTREGSILFQVSSQVKDLQLVMVSGNNNADPTDAESVLAGNRDIYVFPIE